MEASSSPRGSLNKTDIIKAVRGSFIVFAAAFVIGGIEAVQSDVVDGSMSLGGFEIVRPLLVSLGSFLLESTRRYFKAYS